MSSHITTTEVFVSTGARLHFGPLSYQPVTGRHFGGVGVMLDSPGWQVRASALPIGSRDLASGPQSQRAFAVLENLRLHAPCEWNMPPVQVEILRDIPPHRGLGSGTQLALAVGRAVLDLAQISCSTIQLSAVLGRGQRSAIGLHGFDSGGLLIDAGQDPAFGIGELAWQAPLPADWRFLLLCPRGATSPFSGTKERSVFQSLIPMPEDLSGQLARIVLTDMLPALRSADCSRFGAALEAYGERVGGFFSSWQGGTFADAQVSHLVQQLRLEGASGFAQSSWGPTVALPCANQHVAESWLQRVRKLCGDQMETQIAAPLGCRVSPALTNHS